MAQESRTTTKANFQTGDVPTQAQFENFIDSAYWHSDDDFSALSGSSWDGTNKYKTLTGNLTLTLSSTRAGGILFITQDGTGSRTLTINGQELAINEDAGSETIVSYLKVNGVYKFIVNLLGSSGGGSGDVTPPGISSITATNANTIRVVFNESMGVVSALGWAFEKTGPIALTINGVSGGGTTWDFDIDETMTSGDTIQADYNSGTGATTDEAGIELVTFSNASVTNSISGGGGTGLLANLDAYWKLDEAAGAFGDSSGNGRTLSVNGTITRGTGKINDGAATFNNVANYLENTNAGQFTTAFAINFWMRSQSGTFGDRIMSRYTDSDYAWIIYSNAASMRLGVANASVFENTPLSPAINDGAMHMITYSYDGTNIKAYIDGVLDTTTPFTGPVKASSSPFRVFADADGQPGEGGSGLIDEIGLWKRGLTDSEVTSLYNGGAGKAFSTF